MNRTDGKYLQTEFHEQISNIFSEALKNERVIHLQQHPTQQQTIELSVKIKEQGGSGYQCS